MMIILIILSHYVQKKLINPVSVFDEGICRWEFRVEFLYIC
jgi:hypothetical protein